jgi:ABC-2 type transport system ATP-binding protein
MASVLEATDLTKAYKPRRRNLKPTLAVDHISFALQPGEVFGFLGPNGAGKTTTIRTCTGISRPTAGHVTVAGADVMADPVRARERIGVVSDVAGLYGEMSSQDNLLFFARLHSVPVKRGRERAAHLLRLFGMYDSRDRPVASLSTGQRKHLAIAAALMHEPEVLFLDEPTTGLDVQSARQLRAMVRELSERGTAVFLTTHYIEEADQLCHRIAIIDQGRIVAEGTPAQLKSEARGEHTLEFCVDRDATALSQTLASYPDFSEITVAGARVRLRVDDPGTGLELVFRVVTGLGMRLESMTTAEPSLEDAFVRLTGLQSEVMRNESERGG